MSGALPTAVACLQFVALRLVVTRLPLVPNKDLIFVGAGIAAAGMTNLSVTPVATVLVILAAADLVLASARDLQQNWNPVQEGTRLAS